MILGHEIVGEVIAVGAGVERFRPGARVGVPWLGWTCGVCRYCRSGRENLCGEARFTGHTIDGGYAEYAAADERFCFALPAGYPDLAAAPLLCAGLIGYRSLVLAGDAERLGVYGFGAAAHIVAQDARHQGRRVFAFVRPGDGRAQEFARAMGAVWTGASTERPPEELDAAILFAPSGELVPAALRAVSRGGTVVCGGIHMSDIPSFPYEILWGERVLRSVANLTRRDGEEFLVGRAKVIARNFAVGVMSPTSGVSRRCYVRSLWGSLACCLATTTPWMGGFDASTASAWFWWSPHPAPGDRARLHGRDHRWVGSRLLRRRVHAGQ